MSSSVPAESLTADTAKQLVAQLFELFKKYGSERDPTAEPEQIFVDSEYCPEGFLPCTDGRCPTEPGDKTWPTIVNSRGETCYTTRSMKRHRLTATDKTHAVSTIRELVRYVSQLSDLFNQLPADNADAANPGS